MMMKLDRRQFLGSTLAGAGGMLLAQATQAQAAANPFEKVPLGKTGLNVTRISAGTGMRGSNRQSNMTRMGKEAFEALLNYEWDKGIRFFDLADMYGTHPFVASAFKDKPRDQYALCTKIWVRPGALPEKERPDANIVVDRFRKELNTDYIDLVLVHCMSDPDWTQKQKRQMDILADLKAKGIIKAHGVSIHCPRGNLTALESCATSPWVDSVHVRINAFGDAMDDKPEVVAPIVKKIKEAGKGVVGMKLIGEGRYREQPDKRDESIKFALPLVDAMTVGFEKPAEVDDFAARLAKALQARQA